MLSTNTLNSSDFSSCLYISKQYHKCKLNMAHSYQVPSYVDVCAYVHRILQKMCVVFVGNLNLTYEYILNVAFKRGLVPLRSLFAIFFFLKGI